MNTSITTALHQIHYEERKKSQARFLGCGGGVVVSALDFRSEGWWFDAQSLPLCCFLRQETLSHTVFLHPVV